MKRSAPSALPFQISATWAVGPGFYISRLQRFQPQWIYDLSASRILLSENRSGISPHPSHTTFVFHFPLRKKSALIIASVENAIVMARKTPRGPK